MGEDLNEWLAVLGLILSLWGAVPTAVLFRERVRGARSLRRMLALGPQKKIEFMVTSSRADVSRVGPPQREKRALRSLVPSGDLAGVAELGAMLSRAYPAKSFVVTPTGASFANPEADHFVIGGPVRNDYAARLIESCQDTAGITSGLIFDAGTRFIRFGTKEYGPDLDLDFSNNIPRLDYGIVMLAKVQRGPRSCRVLLVAGLTTYGTHAAAHFAAHQLVGYLKQNRLSRPPNVCVLIKAKLVNGRPYHLEAIGHLPGAVHTP